MEIDLQISTMKLAVRKILLAGESESFYTVEFERDLKQHFVSRYTMEGHRLICSKLPQTIVHDACLLSNGKGMVTVNPQSTILTSLISNTQVELVIKNVERLFGTHSGLIAQSSDGSVHQISNDGMTSTLEVDAELAGISPNGIVRICVGNNSVILKSDAFNNSYKLTGVDVLGSVWLESSVLIAEAAGGIRQFDIHTGKLLTVLNSPRRGWHFELQSAIVLGHYVTCLLVNYETGDRMEVCQIEVMQNTINITRTVPYPIAPIEAGLTPDGKYLICGTREIFQVWSRKKVAAF